MKKYFILSKILLWSLFSNLTIAKTITQFYDIGTLPGGNYTYAIAINSQGMVIGYGNTKQSKEHAFVWSKKTGIIDLGALCGVQKSKAIGINSKGDVLVIGEGYKGTTAFVWNAKDGMHNIGTLGGGYTVPITINEAGTVVGASQPIDDNEHAFIWKKNTGMIDLAPASSNISKGYYANNDGMVAGQMYFDFSTGKRYPFIWTSKDGIQDITPYKSPANYEEYDDEEEGVEYEWSKYIPAGINSRGTVIVYDPTGVPRPYIWNKNEGVQILDSCSECQPIAIEDDDTVIVNCPYDYKAFAWTKNTGISPLYTPLASNPYFTSAVAVSSNGIVLGTIKTTTSWGEDLSYFFVWDQHNGAQELTMFDKAVYEPRGINQYKQITGNRYSKQGANSHAFYAEYE